MKIFVAILLLTFELFAGVYYAKVEPVESYTIKSAASGKVMNAYEDAEGQVSKGGVIVQLDDLLNKEDLKNSKLKLRTLKEMLKITLKNLENAKKIAKIREKNYEKIKKMKTKSRVEKDNELVNMINSENQVLSLMSSAESLKSQINDQNYKIASLEDLIAKKRITIPKGFLIYKLYIKDGDYVNVGTPVADVEDISKAKLTIFVSKEDYDLAKNGVIYLDGKKTSYKVNKLWDVADTQNISSYKAEIVIKAPKVFSKLVKIELKPR